MKYHTKSLSEYLLTAGMVFLVIGAAGVLILSGYQYKSKRFSFFDLFRQRANL